MSSDRHGLLTGARILVVDDVDSDRNLLAHYLQRQGCRTYVGLDGEDACRKAIAVQPDIILMEVRMPGCDGLTACRQLGEDARTRDIPVIFLTAAASPEERVEGLRAGAVDYVIKPFDFEEVRLRLVIHLKPLRPPEPGADIAQQQPRLDRNLFESARKQLMSRLDSPPDLAQLAQSTGTSQRRLSEAFKKCVSVTIFEFLREERMKEARHLLANTSLDIQAIALEVGFTSGANFATAFRERFGMSPSAYRRERPTHD